MTGKTNVLVKEFEVKGGGRKKYIIRNIPYQLAINAQYPFNTNAQYYLWRPLYSRGPVAIFPVDNNVYAESLKITKVIINNGVVTLSQESVTVFFEPSKYNDALRHIQTIPIDNANDRDFAITYNNSVIIHKGSYINMNAFLRTVKTDNPIFTFT